MHFVSTRGGVAPTALEDAILAGLAPDGGLYVPETLPQAAPIDDGPSDIRSAALRVLRPFFVGSPLASQLDDIVAEAFTFDAPLKRTPEGLQVLELFHGPTAAFKDFGARFLAAMLRRLRSGAGTLTVLVATSGDTGSAVAAAFHRMPGVRVVILYPDGRVSPRQAHQLGCLGDNVTALRVDGSFDDCQRLVKAAFADVELRARCPLASANSISLGRLLPQMAYYALAAARSRATGKGALNVIVPTGNLGNAFAALLARAIGVEIGQIVLATNANRVLPEFLARGDYLAQPSVATIANAMDVGNPSNVERLRWLLPRIEALRAAVSADWVDDPTIRARIRDGRARYGEVWCPHTACAVEVYERLGRRGDTRTWTVAATAHPAKFETVVEPLIGAPVELPAPLAAMLARPASAEPLAATEAALRARLLATD